MRVCQRVSNSPSERELSRNCTHARTHTYMYTLCKRTFTITSGDSGGVSRK